MAKKSASTTPKSFTEIAKQETRKPTSQTVAFDPDVLDFLTFCQTTIGDLNYCVNNIIRTYRRQPASRPPRTSTGSGRNQAEGFNQKADSTSPKHRVSIE